jgi:hypothetical protein
MSIVYKDAIGQPSAATSGTCTPRYPAVLNFANSPRYFFMKQMGQTVALSSIQPNT